jgi:O-antigen/teichoic acid export membrane protein
MKLFKVGNILAERLIKLLYTIFSLYLGANYFSVIEFSLLQQIILFQSFITVLIVLPVPSLITRLAFTNIKYVESILLEVSILRIILGVLLLILFGVYLDFSNLVLVDITTILLGLIPLLIISSLSTDIVPHIFNFEGNKNWELTKIFALFLIIKLISIVLFKSIYYKIIFEIIEAILLALWNYKTYLKSSFYRKYSNIYKKRVIKLIKLSTGIYMNGILSVFILRIDQLALVSYVDKDSLSNYLLVVSISSLFLMPMSLIGERLTFVFGSAKSKSLQNFKNTSIKYLFYFLIFSIFLYLLFVYSFSKISIIFFNRNLDNYRLISLILGTTIISNSIGMILGLINSTLNDGIYTMKRTFFGCLFLLILVKIGFNYFGIMGVASASAISLFFTNILFWFFSSKIRRIIFT